MTIAPAPRDPKGPWGSRGDPDDDGYDPEVDSFRSWTVWVEHKRQQHAARAGAPRPGRPADRPEGAGPADHPAGTLR